MSVLLMTLSVVCLALSGGALLIDAGLSAVTMAVSAGVWAIWARMWDADNQHEKLIRALADIYSSASERTPGGPGPTEPHK